MKPRPAPLFDVMVTHHRLTRGVPEAADRLLPDGFELAVRGAWALADTLELRLCGGPAGEAPVRVQRLRVQAMTHAGDLLVGAFALRVSAGPAGGAALRSLLGPLAALVQPGPAADPGEAPPRGRGFEPEDSVYPLAGDAAAAAAPGCDWLLPTGHRAIRTLRFKPPAGGFDAVATPAEAGRFWRGLTAAAGCGEAVPESRVLARGVPLRWHVHRPLPMLTPPAAATSARLRPAAPPVAAVA